MLRTTRKSLALYPKSFQLALVKVVGRGAPGGIVETDVRDAMRAEGWSFGMADFRGALGRAVATDIIVETQGRQRGGGIETRYTLPDVCEHGYTQGCRACNPDGPRGE